MTKTRPWPIIILLAAMIIFVSSAVLFGLPQWRQAAAIGQQARARAELEALAEAGQAYFRIHRQLPARVTLELLNSLSAPAGVRSGGNTSGLTLTNASGEVVDLWGSPVHLSLDPLNRVQVQSAGPNRVPGDHDDLLVSAAPPDDPQSSRLDNP